MTHRFVKRLVVYNLIAIGFLVFMATTSNADGIQAYLMEPYLTVEQTCESIQSREQIEGTVEGDPEGVYAAYIQLFVDRCGMIYIPGDARYHWGQPKPLPQVPSQVPLPATLGLLLGGMFMFVAAVKLSSRNGL